ncbi:DUF1800 domain-containing protein [Rhodoferax aquaticus]|uniref:DUF1800 domain-containing protein n=1 Tax=Rhodoferax aquaticus TaxID=2527691 RepID=A0A515EJQ4_9BURK|nr:DUF1800 domain-containing protein [Rhodoferax aquaticus]QDL52907.1 DUF1800 domain-containing protein [Rhodoferax aquaticus]
MNEDSTVIEAVAPPTTPQRAGPGVPSTALLSVLASAALAACGGGSTSSTTSSLPQVPGPNVNLPNTAAPVKPATDQEAARFLLQAQFSASDAEIAAVKAQGYAPWLQTQIAASYTTGWDWLTASGYADVNNPKNYYDVSYTGDRMVWNQLLTGNAAVRKRWALALSEIFVVSLTSIEMTWRGHAMAHYWDTLCKYATGNYRDLLEAITLMPAMGYFLNTKGNRKEDPASGRLPDENYAREVMQLFTIGLVNLHMDGTPVLVGGKPVDSYNADDVSNLARVFTGYDIDWTKNTPTTIGSRKIPSINLARLPMVVNDSNHSGLAATLKFNNSLSTGINIPAFPADGALKTALDALFNHANTAPFICKQLIQRLVTSNPSPAYVGRVAAVFANNGSGVRGDLAYVFAAILTDTEARGAAGLTHPEFGKLREPMVRLAQWGRTFGATSPTEVGMVGDLSDPSTSLGQSPLRAPSVFNFFRPGYTPPFASLTAGTLAPEFQQVNETSVGGYLNTMFGFVDVGIRTWDSGVVDTVAAPYTAELAIVDNASSLVNRINLLLCAGQLSTTTVKTIVDALNKTPVTNTSSAVLKRNRICAAVLLTMASAEYLIQK